MISLNKVDLYLRAIWIGFEDYGLNGFYHIQNEITNERESPWEDDLAILNELDYDEFELLCAVYLKAYEKSCYVNQNGGF